MTMGFQIEQQVKNKTYFGTSSIPLGVHTATVLLECVRTRE